MPIPQEFNRNNPPKDYYYDSPNHIRDASGGP